MPEEINRVLTDQLADLCLRPAATRDANLRSRGYSRRADPRRRQRHGRYPAAHSATGPAKLGVPATAWAWPRTTYAFVTFHRPSNVDRSRHPGGAPCRLWTIWPAQMPVLFLVHPRTRQRIADFGLEDMARRVHAARARSAISRRCRLVEQAALVLTDSGGLQEETTVLGVPCLTARANTERPGDHRRSGTNRLVALDAGQAISAAVAEVLGAGQAASFRPGRPEAGMAAPGSGSSRCWPEDASEPYQQRRRASLDCSLALSATPRRVRRGP